MIKNKKNSVMFLLGTLETGGSESKFVRLARRLTASGRSVHVAYFSQPENLLPLLDGIPVVNLDRKGKWSPHAFRALSKYIEKHGVSSIISVNLYPLAYAIPLLALRRHSSTRVIASVNTSEMPSQRDRAFMRLYAPLLRRCDQVVFGSERQRHDWLKMYNLPGEHSTVIHNGVDGKYFDCSAVLGTKEEIRASLNISNDACVIVCVSRLRPEKAHRNLLQAIGMLEMKHGLKPHVLLVGDGIERSAIVEYSQHLAINDRLHMIGSTDDVRPFLKASDIFALTSTSVETFSNAALEATAMGLPVVISDVGGALEMFPHGSSGTVYPRNDIDSLFDALFRNLQNVQSSNIDKGAIRARVLQKFSTEAMDNAWSDVIWGPVRSKNSELDPFLNSRREH